MSDFPGKGSRHRDHDSDKYRSNKLWDKKDKPATIKILTCEWCGWLSTASSVKAGSKCGECGRVGGEL